MYLIAASLSGPMNKDVTFWINKSVAVSSQVRFKEEEGSMVHVRLMVGFVVIV